VILSLSRRIFAGVGATVGVPVGLGVASALGVAPGLGDAPGVGEGEGEDAGEDEGVGVGVAWINSTLAVHEVILEQVGSSPPTSTVAVTVWPPSPSVFTVIDEVPWPLLMVPAEADQL
jgi:hypothetical protein